MAKPLACLLACLMMLLCNGCRSTSTLLDSVFVGPSNGLSSTDTASGTFEADGIFIKQLDVADAEVVAGLGAIAGNVVEFRAKDKVGSRTILELMRRLNPNNRYMIERALLNLHEKTESEHDFYLYIIVTDVISAQEEIHAAFQGYLCNFESKSKQSARHIIPFYIPITTTDSTVVISEQPTVQALMDLYDLRASRALAEQIKPIFGNESIAIIASSFPLFDTLLNSKNHIQTDLMTLSERIVVLPLTGYRPEEIRKMIVAIRSAVKQVDSKTTSAAADSLSLIEKTKEPAVSRSFRRIIRAVLSDIIGRANATPSGVCAD